MSIMMCETCGNMIDTDFDVEHFDVCADEMADRERSSEELLATLNKARAEMKEMGL